MWNGTNYHNGRYPEGKGVNGLCQLNGIVRYSDLALVCGHSIRLIPATGNRCMEKIHAKKNVVFAEIIEKQPNQEEEK